MTAKEANLAYRRMRNKYEEVHLKNAAMELQLKKAQKDCADVDKRHKSQLDKNVTSNNELEGEKEKCRSCKTRAIYYKEDFQSTTIWLRKSLNISVN